MRFWWKGTAVLGAALALSTCGSNLKTQVQSPRRTIESSWTPLLVMSDGLLYDPVAVNDLLASDRKSHARLAEILGRVGDDRALPILERLLADSRPEVRRSAAFALGILGSPAAAPALAAAVVDGDEETGRLAVEALARLGEPTDRWLGTVSALPEDDRLKRLLPALFRLPATEIDRWLLLDAVELKPEQRRWLVYAAGRNGGAEAAELLRRFLGDADPWIRGWAARGLGRLGGDRDIDSLRLLLEDPEPSPAIQALRAAGRLVAAGRTAAPEEWTADILRLLADPRTGVRIAALEVAGYWLPDESLETAIVGIFEDGSGRERELALLAMAGGRTARAEESVLRSSLAPSDVIRSAAATAAGLVGLPEVLEMLTDDPVPAVRLSAIATVLEDAQRDHSTLIQRALVDDDPAVRAAGLEYLSGSPVLPLEEILKSMQHPGAARIVDLAVNGVSALEARYSNELERGAVIAALESLASDSDYLVRRAAADALERLGRPRPGIGWVDTKLGIKAYREMANRLEAERRVVIETRYGSLTVQLACLEAPLTCSSFLQLINQGFYDGLSFHRVVPDFVVQGGDPRGDGWGGPGYSLRDERNRLRFERGVIGMARSGAHTGGSQFFLTLSEQPHLDGEYTAFGRVVSGIEVLDEIVQGDRILGIREVREDHETGVDSGP